MDLGIMPIMIDNWSVGCNWLSIMKLQLIPNRGVIWGIPAGEDIHHLITLSSHLAKGWEMLRDEMDRIPGGNGNPDVSRTDNVTFRLLKKSAEA